MTSLDKWLETQKVGKFCEDCGTELFNSEALFMVCKDYGECYDQEEASND